MMISCTLMMVLSTLYSMSSHPVMFTSIILIQSILISVMLWLSSSCSWFSYILFLVFLGGLMVLFVYITSLASNEIVWPKNKTLKINFFVTLMFVAILILQFKNNNKILTNTFSVKTFFIDLYSMNVILLVVFSMVYLLLTLVVVVKTANKNEAPIKSIFK